MSRLCAVLVCAAVCGFRVWGDAPAFYAMDTAFESKGAQPLDEKLDALVSMGYAGMCGTGDDPVAIRALIAKLEARKLKLAAQYVAFPFAKEGLQMPAKLDELLAVLGPQGTVLWAYVPDGPDAPKEKEKSPEAVSAFKALAQRAAAKGVKVALYPHAGFWIHSTDEAARLAQAVNEPAFGVSFNLCHALKAGEGDRAEALIKSLGPKLYVLQINGADKAGTEWNALIQPLGKGDFDVAAVVRAARMDGWAGPVVFQGYGIGGDWRDVLRDTMAEWRRMTGGE